MELIRKPYICWKVETEFTDNSDPITKFKS